MPSGTVTLRPRSPGWMRNVQSFLPAGFRQWKAAVCGPTLDACRVGPRAVGFLRTKPNAMGDPLPRFDRVRTKKNRMRAEPIRQIKTRSGDHPGAHVTRRPERADDDQASSRALHVRAPRCPFAPLSPSVLASILRARAAMNSSNFLLVLGTAQFAQIIIELPAHFVELAAFLPRCA